MSFQMRKLLRPPSPSRALSCLIIRLVTFWTDKRCFRRQRPFTVLRKNICPNTPSYLSRLIRLCRTLMSYTFCLTSRESSRLFFSSKPFLKSRPKTVRKWPARLISESASVLKYRPSYKFLKSPLPKLPMCTSNKIPIPLLSIKSLKSAFLHVNTSFNKF